MNKLLKVLILTGAALMAPWSHAGDVGVSVSIGQPGFYGRIDVGRMPAPAVVYAEPVLVQRVYAPPPPVYMRVPEGHYRHWSRHCHAYGVCGRPVYFVREDWYARQYAPAYYGRPVYGPPPHHVHRPHWDRPGHRDWDRRDWDRRDGHGHRGHGGHDRRDHHDRHDRRDWDGRGDHRGHHRDR